MRPPNWPNIVIASFTIVTVDAFWMRILWKNGENGQAVIDNFNDENPDPYKVSPTGRYPDGAYECSSLQSLTGLAGPEDPVPGIISVINSPRLGVYVHYLLFYENANCSNGPTMVLKFMLPASMANPSGDAFIFDFMERTLPPFRSWKQANPHNKMDKVIVRAFDSTLDSTSWPDHQSLMMLYIPDQGGIMRWRSIVDVTPAQPEYILTASDETIEASLARSLKNAYSDWWTREQAYQAEQAALNTDFASEEFNFVVQPFPMVGEKISSLMVGFEFIREHPNDPRAQELQYLMGVLGTNGGGQQGHPSLEHLQDLEEQLGDTGAGMGFEDMSWTSMDNWATDMRIGGDEIMQGNQDPQQPFDPDGA
ncbi:hypothetical protein TWF696_004607 [Orbilia brochopaga]|uniref:Uncharacterized protein n=1 Tax=Orbilia brochopaga TaxID=3140254 RepID=A0AAV9V8H3_9PEZI